jgi:hypothetical protein
VARLSKNSSNSSKPPSSDITKPKAKSHGQGQNKIGAQPGHPKHERALFPEGDIKTFHDYRLSACPECDNPAVTFLDLPPRVIQQMELETFVITKEEHRSYPVWCERCGQIHYQAFPSQVVKEGLFKERLTALVAYMKAVDHASFSTIRKFIRDVLGCDYFSAYHKYMTDFNVTVQFCIAHLIRDIKYLTGLPDTQTRAYGKKLLAAVKAMFEVIHEREHLAPDAFLRALERARESILDAALNGVPSRLDPDGKEQKREAFNLAQRFRENGKAYFEFILQAVRAYFRDRPAPSLLPGFT